MDLLVVMPAPNQHTQAVRILWRLAAPFPIDLVVRTPKQLAWRLEEGESFLTAIVSGGKVLYARTTGPGQEPWQSPPRTGNVGHGAAFRRNGSGNLILQGGAKSGSDLAG